MPGKVEIKTTSNGQYRFVLEAGTVRHRDVRELHHQGVAKNGMESVKTNAKDAEVVYSTGE
jgi:uncharacterized protein YegP (UPF0339 family)